MNKWRAIIALVVAFVLGIGVGGLVEHQRAKSKSNKKTATTTAGKTAVGVRWFPNPPTDACPGLVKWQTAASTAYVDLLKKTAWPATQTSLEAQSAAASTALKGLLPHANKIGHKGLNVLINRETKNLAALKAAKDEAAYLTASKALTTPAVKKGNVVLGKAKVACSGTTSTTAKATT
jgi:hypothetical protein